MGAWGDFGALTALVAAAVGAIVSLVFQAFARRWRIAQARRAFRVDLGLLLRHIASSLESLSISPDAPEYLIAARLRFARFEDLLLTPDRLERVEALEEQERARILIAAIRNSDILLDEIASRIPGYSVENRARAMEQARLNLRILRETIERLSLSDIAVPPLTAVTLAAQVQRTLREKEMHSEPSDGSHAD